MVSILTVNISHKESHNQLRTLAMTEHEELTVDVDETMQNLLANSLRHNISKYQKVRIC